MLDGSWKKTKKVTGTVWGVTKDVSSTAYCSVKSVFFNSNCRNNNRRSRRQTTTTYDDDDVVDSSQCDDASFIGFLLEEKVSSVMNQERYYVWSRVEQRQINQWGTKGVSLTPSLLSSHSTG